MDKILCRLKILRRGTSATESHVTRNSVLQLPQSSPSTPCTVTDNTANKDYSETSSHTFAETSEAGLGSSDQEDLSKHPHARHCIQTASETAWDRDTTNNHDEGEAEEASSFHTFTGAIEPVERKFTEKDLSPLCEQLRRLLDYIHSTMELKNLIYSYPSNQQNILEEQAKELHALFTEVRAARLSVQQVKNQRKAVRKECNAVLKTLSKIKEEEIKEMENFISLYDKTLLAKWEKIRNSTQEDMVESFLHDLQGKQQALSHLQTLASHKLGQLQNSSQTKTAEETKPVSLAVRRLSGSGSGRNSAARWRSKHYERTVRTPSCSTSQDPNPLPLVPVMPAIFSLTQGHTLPISSGGSSSTSCASPSPNTRISSISSSFIPTNPQASINNADHRSMLQALFSNLQTPGTHDNLPINAVIPEIIATTSGRTAHERDSNRRSRNRQNSDSDSESEYQDIELYSIND